MFWVCRHLTAAYLVEALQGILQTMARGRLKIYHRALTFYITQSRADEKNAAHTSPRNSSQPRVLPFFCSICQINTFLFFPLFCKLAMDQAVLEKSSLCCRNKEVCLKEREIKIEVGRKKHFPLWGFPHTVCSWEAGVPRAKRMGQILPLLYPALAFQPLDQAKGLYSHLCFLGGDGLIVS